jgi:hypothetical protein
MLEDKVTALPATVRYPTESHTIIGRIPIVYTIATTARCFTQQSTPFETFPRVHLADCPWFSLATIMRRQCRCGVGTRGFWCPHLHDHAVTLSKNLVSQKVSIATDLCGFEMLCSLLRNRLCLLQHPCICLFTCDMLATTTYNRRNLNHCECLVGRLAKGSFEG